MPAPAMITVHLVTDTGQPLGATHIRADVAAEFGIGRNAPVAPAEWHAVIEAERKRNAEERR